MVCEEILKFERCIFKLSTWIKKSVFWNHLGIGQ